MKSKLFGLNAKLALAVLAVGTMFASCYDSENGDVTKPYKAPKAVITIAGTVTNNVTGAPVEKAGVSLSGDITSEEQKLTDKLGSYQFVKQIQGGTKAGQKVSVNVAGTSDYEAVTETIDLDNIEDGQSVTYYKNLMVNYTSYLPEGLKVTTSTMTESQETEYSGEKDSEHYEVGLDIINKTNEPLLVKKNFIVSEGAIVTEDKQNVFDFTTKSADDVKKAIRDYITADLKKAPTKEYDTVTKTYDILVAPLSALKSVTVSYLYEIKTYNFTYATDTYVVKVQRIVKVTLSNEQTSISHYHGHGHGHGHGGDINAGGGILTPEM